MSRLSGKSKSARIVAEPVDFRDPVIGNRYFLLTSQLRADAPADAMLTDL
jgi:hypothetical protein